MRGMKLGLRIDRDGGGGGVAAAAVKAAGGAVFGRLLLSLLSSCDAFSVTHRYCTAHRQVSPLSE